MQSYRNPAALWFGSPNFTPDRDGHDMNAQPAYVVLHTMVGTVASANNRFQKPAEKASATYGVGLDGRLYQWVDEKDAAWANGTLVDNPGSNMDSISIEHEDDGDYNGPRTPQLYEASARLVRDICQRYGIPIDRQHVIEHRECATAHTSCPDALDVDRIVRTAAGPVAPVEDAVAGVHVPGRIWHNARWYSWLDLSPLQTTDETGATGAAIVWTEARKVGGTWYDRIARPDGSPGDWALNDGDVDDTQPGDGAPPGGWDPTHFRPRP